jgi:hypothetical protein
MDHPIRNKPIINAKGSGELFWVWIADLALPMMFIVFHDFQWSMTDLIKVDGVSVEFPCKVKKVQMGLGGMPYTRVWENWREYNDEYILSKA